MSARVIVSLGVWILVTVLLGTLTIGLALAFYVLLTVCFAVLVLALTLLARRRDDRRDHSYL
ncbi:hypothetical protein [Azospirillum sp. TSO35-2]|uniref:hypothetical protein n=1 Tax=Azospirillum sp. TSO35-2 TaxID=716796 RepID=UPI000D60741A|nr:hypothetical protein [Azospirillum sp. TSO35-2]PWC34018.1 hypothetical protein TSO352_27190 [Azospirillum sp. TSO35-2]